MIKRYQSEVHYDYITKVYRTKINLKSMCYDTKT